MSVSLKRVKQRNAEITKGRLYNDPSSPTYMVLGLIVVAETTEPIALNIQSLHCNDWNHHYEIRHLGRSHIHWLIYLDLSGKPRARISVSFS